MLQRNRGASALTYAVMVGLVGVVAIATVSFLGESVTDLFSDTAGSMETAAGSIGNGSGDGDGDGDGDEETPAEREGDIYINQAGGGDCSHDAPCTLSEAEAAAQPGDVMLLLEDISASSGITLHQGQTLASASGRHALSLPEPSEILCRQGEASYPACCSGASNGFACTHHSSPYNSGGAGELVTIYTGGAVITVADSEGDVTISDLVLNYGNSSIAATAVLGDLTVDNVVFGPVGAKGSTGLAQVTLTDGTFTFTGNDVNHVDDSLDDGDRPFRTFANLGLYADAEDVHAVIDGNAFGGYATMIYLEEGSFTDGSSISFSDNTLEQVDQPLYFNLPTSGEGPQFTISGNTVSPDHLATTNFFSSNYDPLRLTVTGNTFRQVVQGPGLTLHYFQISSSDSGWSGTNQVDFSNNTVISGADDGWLIYYINKGTYRISNNILTGLGLIHEITPNGPLSLEVANNSVTGGPSGDTDAEFTGGTGSGITCLAFDGNTVENQMDLIASGYTAGSLRIEQYSTLASRNSVGSINVSGTVTDVASNTCARLP
jgi:Flp pilus assembly pilin Flp